MKTISLLVVIAATVAASTGAEALQLKRLGPPGDLVSLNPQPLPPGATSGIIIVSGRGSKTSLNPQPLPPGAESGIIIVGGRGGAVSLNPQPLPPKANLGFN